MIDFYIKIKRIITKHLHKATKQHNLTNRPPKRILHFVNTYNKTKAE